MPENLWSGTYKFFSVEAIIFCMLISNHFLKYRFALLFP